MAMERKKPEQTRLVRQSLKEKNQRRIFLQVMEDALRNHDMVLEIMQEFV